MGKQTLDDPVSHVAQTNKSEFLRVVQQESSYHLPLSTAFSSVRHCEMETGPAKAYPRQGWEASPPSSGFFSGHVSGRNASHPA